MSESLALLGTLVASGVWWVEGVLEPVRSWVSVLSPFWLSSGLLAKVVCFVTTAAVCSSLAPAGGLYSQHTWGDFTLSLGIGANVVGVSWVGVTGSPRADLEKEEAASIV